MNKDDFQIGIEVPDHLQPGSNGFTILEDDWCKERPANQDIQLGHLCGRIFYLEEELLVKCTVRLSQVMVYKRPFDLNEALGGRDVMATAVLHDDLVEFMHLFRAEDRSIEEAMFIEDIRHLDFAITVSDKCAGNIDLLMHELCHVLYYYDAEHRKLVHEAWNDIDELDRMIIESWLKESGYEDLEIVDEWFAHLFHGFENRERMLRKFSVSVLHGRTKELLTEVLTGHGL